MLILTNGSHKIDLGDYSSKEKADEAGRQAIENMKKYHNTPEVEDL
jgi:hypothetical protein